MSLPPQKYRQVELNICSLIPFLRTGLTPSRAELLQLSGKIKLGGISGLCQHCSNRITESQDH